ncbi:MAG: tRNA (N6-isopentenyl adenosine(37)-C2)-methylthiotransferase MiaB [Bacilli bacterium]|nr:tRNA (N6-isopentenyl adenosine(37)-C2)-methylthiotransferase MiaB [Bacilli bacterium]
MQKPNMVEARKRSQTNVKVIRDGYKLDAYQKSIGVNKKYYIETYGCQMNVHDSETISAILEDLGYSYISSKEEADLIILNTCSIRENAHNKVFGMLGIIKHLKKSKPNLIVGLCGCMAQEEVIINAILEKYNWLDFVFGTHNINNLPNILSKALNKRKLEIEVYSIEGDIIENLPIKRESKYKAWVNIMYGCDKFCTYCIVPYTRGKQRSRLPEAIIKEVKELVEDGYQEVTLLGQNVNAYGKDFKDSSYDMSNLLQDISNTGINRIRFMTSHPWDFTDNMIKVINDNKNIMPYIHLPIQSGSNRILKLMGRKYTREEYINLFNKLKEAIPNVSISTDIIVGFPGETDADFEETVDIYNQLKFDFAFTFLFSKRVGTPAEKLLDETPIEVKNNRLYELNKLVNKYALESNLKLKGQMVKVLIDGVSNKDKEILSGYTDTNKLVNVKGDINNIGKIVTVEIKDVKTWSLSGEIVNK